MCGIAGFLMSGSARSETMQKHLQLMTDAIVHRGPDEGGAWVCGASNVALGHRRLSIVDLSSTGAQPMMSRSERFVIVYNGEVYNHLDIRGELESTAPGCQWRGNSDSETLVMGFDVWGITLTLQRAVGMFALAIWDREREELTLARDRFGEKPLYYGWQGLSKPTFIFGSELAALRAYPTFSAEIDRSALCSYLRHNCVGGTRSIYKNIFKLAPGSLLSLSLRDPTPVVTSYWSAKESVLQGFENPFCGSEEEAVEKLNGLLCATIAQQMVADVPVGAFLSGGVDSSLIVALMQAQSSRPVKTFTIGFGEKKHDEAVVAKAVAKQLGTDHAELYVTPAHVMTVIQKLSKLYSEPFADSSQIPTFLVSQLARQKVTVVLAGDAGVSGSPDRGKDLLVKRLGWGGGRFALDHAAMADREAAQWAVLAKTLGADVDAFNNNLEDLDYSKLEPVSSMSRRLSED